MKKPPTRVTLSELRHSENRPLKRQFQSQFQMSVVLLYDICFDYRYKCHIVIQRTFAIVVEIGVSGVYFQNVEVLRESPLLVAFSFTQFSPNFCPYPKSLKTLSHLSGSKFLQLILLELKRFQRQRAFPCRALPNI